MRLQQYITEATDINTLSNIISDNCKPFLKEFGVAYSQSNLSKNFIYRGMHIYITGDYTIKKPRSDRKPKLVDDRLHNFMNKIGMDLFGWRIRTEGIFTSFYTNARNYGIPYIFIPLGNYKYVFIRGVNKIYGLYDMHVTESSFLEGIEDRIKTSDETKTSDKYKKDKARQLAILSDIEREIEDVYRHQYKTSGLEDVIRGYNEWEAIFNCDRYIVISNKIQNKLEDIIKNLI